MYTRYILLWLISHCFVYSSTYADCSVPQSLNVYNVTHQSASFSWYSNYYTNPPTYQLQWRVAGGANWNTNPVTTFSLSLTGLTNNTTYEWRVRSICAVGDTSAYVIGAAFQTKCNPPVYLNVSNVTYESAQLSWGQPVSGATYEVQWRPAGSTAWTVVTNLTTGYLKLTGLTDQTPYEWQVRTLCSSTITSDFVSGTVFQTRCLPPTNTRTNLINPDAAEVKWDSPIANVSFDLQWRPAGSSTWTLIEGITTNEYSLTGLSNTTDYVWQVRTACSAASKSSFSDAQYFRTNCPAPTNLGTGSITSTAAVLRWTNFASDLQWRASGTANWTTVPNARSPFSLTGLTNNTTYEWQVRTVCSSTATSAYTASQVFTTQCSPPASTYASANQASGFDIFWTASDDGPFDVQWRVTGAASWSVATGIVGTTYRLTGLVAQQAYDWRVRRVCSATEYSTFVTGQFAQVTCYGPSYSQSGNATSSTIDLSWEAGATGSRYDLEWRVSGAANWTTVSGISANQYTLTGLQSAVPYEWHVRKVCAGGVASTYTANQTFTLTCSQPGSFNSYNVDFSSATVGWSASSGSIYPPYELQYRPLGAANWIAIPSINISSYSLTGLTSNTTYEWRVRASCSASESAFSPVQTFQTQCPTPFTLRVSTVKFNSAQLNWYASTNTKLYEIQYRESGSADWISVRPEGPEADPTFGMSSYYYDKQYTLYNLTPGKTYQWRVRTQCMASVYSDFVAGFPFTTVCSPLPSLAATQQTNTSLEISWYSPSTITELQWRAVGTPTWNTINGLTTSNYTLTGLTTGGSYEYRVRQQCSPDVMSAYSTTYTAQLRCLSPAIASAQTLSASSVQLRWAYSSDNVDASAIRHELQYRIVGTPDWTSVTGLVGTAYALTGLTTGASYEARIRTLCTPDLQADFSSTFTFALSCPVPYPNSYNSQISATSATLFWNNNSAYAGPFLLQWREAGMSTWATVSVPYPPTTYTYVTAYTLTGLANNTTYEWRVAANCGTNYLSDFSAIQSFRTTCPAAESAYTKSVGSTNAQLSWYVPNMPTGTTFTVQYRPSGRVVWSELSGVTSTSAVLTSLAANTTYEWRVRTECGSGNAAGFSSSITFTTQCPAPTALSYTGLTTRSAQLIWTPNPDNAFVNLRWRPSGANMGWNVVNGLTSSTYSLTGLTPGTYYDYQLQGVCSVENQVTNASWTSTAFTTSYPPSFVLNVDSIFAQTVRFNWLNGPDRTNYVLQWRVQNGTWNTSGPLATKRYLVTGLLVNTTYEVRLSYTDDNAVPYQASTTFTTSCPKPYNQYTYDIASNKARLAWATVGVPLTLQWRIAGTSPWNAVPNLTTGSYTLTGLINNTTYEWRLLTPCSTDATTSTYPLAFRTICSMPTAPITQNVSTEAALLTWTGTSTAYTLQYRVAGTNDWTTLSNLTSTSFVVSGLTNNTAYEWAVGTVCDANTPTTFTSPLLFRTQCSSPTGLSVNRLASDWVELRWSKSSPTSQLQWRLVGQAAWNDQPSVSSPYTLTGLTPGSTYEWRVRATCPAEPDAAFMYGSNFTPQCDTYYAERTGTITPNSARLTWNANPPSVYGVRWRVVGSSAWNVVPGNVTSPYLLTSLTNNTTYEWQLRSACLPGYGSSQVFQTHCNSPINLQTETLTSNSVTLRWTDPSDGVGYKIRWRVAGTSTWNTVSDISATSYALTGLTNFTTYEWQVGSQCTNDESDFQLTASFKTIDPNACPQGMYTVRAGPWDDPAVWSCNRLPTGTDSVQIKHAITLQPNYAAKALSIRYEIGGQLAVGAGATIQMGN